MQQYDSNFFVVAVMFKRDKLRRHPRPNIAVDTVAIATGASKKLRGSCLLLLS